MVKKKYNALNQVDCSGLTTLGSYKNGGRHIQLSAFQKAQQPEDTSDTLQHRNVLSL